MVVNSHPLRSLLEVNGLYAHCPSLTPHPLPAKKHIYLHTDDSNMPAASVGHNYICRCIFIISCIPISIPVPIPANTNTYINILILVQIPTIYPFVDLNILAQSKQNNWSFDSRFHSLQT
jgi:hypothetical protein